MSRLISALLAALLVLPLGASRSHPGQDAGGMDGTAPLKGFNERIAAYAAVHHRLEQSLPPLSSSSRRSVLLNRTFLAAAIKAARPHARQGDIFTIQVALIFRTRLATALAGRDTEAFLRELFEEHPGTEGYHVKVYEPYPEWASHEVPTIFLQVLPNLPEDIEYRLLGRDLVLWDIHADLVVDVLIDALPARNSRDST